MTMDPRCSNATPALLAVLLGMGCAPSRAPGPAPAPAGALAGRVDTIIPFTRGAPFGAAASSRGLAYVTVHGGVSALGSWDFGSRRAVQFAAATGREPTNVAFSPDGNTAYVASQYASAVDRVPTGAAAPDASWATEGNHPYQVAVSPDGRRVYATGNAGFLYIFDAASGTSMGRIRTASAPNGLAVARDGRQVFVTHLGSPDIGIVDVEAESYRTLGSLDGAQGQGIVLAEEDRTLFAVSQSGNQLCRFDIVARRRTGCATTAPEPFGLALTADGRELWVTTLEGLLQRFRVPDLSLIATLELGGQLRRIAIDPAGRGAVIADETGRMIVVK